MNQQPNVNTWKCHNPQWRVLDFCRRRGKHPSLLQNKQNSKGCDGSPRHQGQQVLWDPDPGGETEAERMWLHPLWSLGRSIFSLRCFQITPRCRRVKLITLQLKIKMSLFWGDAATQNLTMRRAKDGSLCIKSMCITLHQSMRQGD